MVKVLKQIIRKVISYRAAQSHGNVVPSLDREFMKRYVAKSIGAPGIFVEIGSATGVNSVRFAKKCGLDPRNCYLIEACPVNYEVLLRNAPEFCTFNLAITSKSGTIPFYIVDDPKEPGTSRSNTISLKALREKLPQQRIKQIYVQSMTLTQFFHENNLDRVDYLFFNCEGAEYDIFAGDVAFLERVKLIYLDLHGNCEAFNALHDEKLRIFDLLCHAGFTRVAGHRREDILTYTGHLSFLWERDAVQF